ncbi:MAG TPA: 4Fe-4S binding protein, partial [Verrucomicrobiae bacterium]|nr:4Fe-4S binding protein [Verrucomicrobiae bacterium]
LIGMRITIGEFFKPTVTVRYPHETLKIPPRFRGHIELVCDPETGKPKCFVCKLCEKACPSDCITVEGIKPEGARRKTVTSYRLDFTKCSLCGSCVEACRDGAIRFSRDYNLAGLSKEEFVMDLFQRLESESSQSAVQNSQPSSSAAKSINSDQSKETTTASSGAAVSSPPPTCAGAPATSPALPAGTKVEAK